jgi:U3 small nucleolar RNA-associated protein 3
MLDSEKECLKKKKKMNKTSIDQQQTSYESEDEVMKFISEEYNEDDIENKDISISDIECLEHFNVPNEKAWGTKKKSYYSTDYIDADYLSVSQKDISKAAFEEEESKNLQKQLTEYLDETDFGLDLIVSDNFQFGKDNEHIKIDLNQLSKRQKHEFLEKESPELISLILDLHGMFLIP